MTVLSVRNLRKVYPGKKPFLALDGISFDLKEGEILGLLGPNGAGKTTTIQMLMSTLKPTSGQIFYFGKDLAKHRSSILQYVTFASTYVSLPWNLTIAQNLDIYSRLFSFHPKNIQERRDLLLERFGINEKLHSRVSSLSSGQITRLMLVKAFMVKPKVVLLDEPTASLDPDVAKEVIEFVIEQSEKEKTSILFTSHNMGEVAEICDRVLFLKKGKIFADDIPQNLAKSAAKSVVRLVITEGIEKVVAIAQKMHLEPKLDHRSITFDLDEKEIAHLLTSLARAEVVYSSIQIKQPTLEDFFIHVASDEEKS